MILGLLLTLSLSFAESTTTQQLTIQSISLFRSSVVLGANQNKQVKVGSRLVTQNATNHKCLLVVTKVVNNVVYADATQCPGFATLKKRQTVELAPDTEENNEVHFTSDAKES